MIRNRILKPKNTEELTELENVEVESYCKVIIPNNANVTLKLTMKELEVASPWKEGVDREVRPRSCKSRSDRSPGRRFCWCEAPGEGLPDLHNPQQSKAMDAIQASHNTPQTETETNFVSQ